MTVLSKIIVVLCKSCLRKCFLTLAGPLLNVSRWDSLDGLKLNWAASRWWMAYLHLCLLIRGHITERLVTQRLHDSSTTRQGDNVLVKREWRIGRGRSRENVFFNPGERDWQREIEWVNLSPDVSVSMIQNVLSHTVSLALYPFQDLGLERGCRSGCLGRALSETGINCASLCEFHWRLQGKAPSHEDR